ncbi:UTP--glucose-1-phosphate uridylyltransferase GalU [Pseudofulvimonas gallinarii]|nr:UTP--glucose-1-phosphate uridylyltransferase GalU [Pseudofulvimonas gallinarii]THD12431.1 UTP--glucose-1-phosphate uridylyltransferase [Pseudofulvimonas gallinarii]
MSTPFRIRTAVFPVAGLGTRFLPASKVVPKEMLPVVDMPLIQYAANEAVEAGCTTLVFVVNRYKHAIADYFDTAYELEHRLELKGKDDLLATVRSTLPEGVRCVFVTQSEAMGLGHAVLCARPVVGNEPFAVLLPDDLIWNRERGALAQMVEVAERERSSVIAVQDVPREKTGSYGIVSLADESARDGDVLRMSAIVEKPAPERAPSTLAVVGRYVLSGAVFDLLERTAPGAGNEIQLTDAIEALIEADSPVHAYRFKGTRYDCGNKLGLVQATLRYALDDPDLAAPTLAHLRTLLAERGHG